MQLFVGRVLDLWLEQNTILSLSINRLFVYREGGNFIIFIWAWSAKQGKPGSIYNLGRTNVHAFHENPNRMHTELTFINP